MKLWQTSILFIIIILATCIGLTIGFSIATSPENVYTTVMDCTNSAQHTPSITITHNSPLFATLSISAQYSNVPHYGRITFEGQQQKMNLIDTQNISKVTTNKWKITGKNPQLTYLIKKNTIPSQSGEQWIFMQKPKVTFFNAGVQQIGCSKPEHVQTQQGYVANSPNFYFTDTTGTYQATTHTVRTPDQTQTHTTFYTPSQSHFTKQKRTKILTQYKKLSQEHQVTCHRNLALFPLPNTNNGKYSGKTYYSNESFSTIWVNAEKPVNNTHSVWLHEYIHSRQCYATTPQMKWIQEGITNYYQHRYGITLYTPNQSKAIQEAEQHFKSQPFTNSTLASPKTWQTNKVPYNKGEKVILFIDYKLQQHNSSIEKISRWMNSQEKITYPEFKTKIVSETTKQVGIKLDSYILNKTHAPYKEKYFLNTTTIEN